MEHFEHLFLQLLSNIIPLNHYNSPLTQVIIHFIFFRRGNCTSERLRDYPVKGGEHLIKLHKRCQGQKSQGETWNKEEKNLSPFFVFFLFFLSFLPSFFFFFVIPRWQFAFFPFPSHFILGRGSAFSRGFFFFYLTFLTFFVPIFLLFQLPCDFFFECLLILQ